MSYTSLYIDKSPADHTRQRHIIAVYVRPILQIFGFERFGRFQGLQESRFMGLWLSARAPAPTAQPNAHVLAPPPQPSAPAKTQPRTNRAAAGHAARVCAAPTDTTNPPATDGPILSPSARAPAPAAQPNAHVLAPPPRPCPPGKTPPAMKQGKLWQAVCVCAALTDATNPPATDKPTPHP